MRKFNENSIVVATHNIGKFEEMKKLLDDGAPEISVYSSNEFEIDEPEEVGHTYIENARIKARYSSEKTGLACLSDDSGIEVDGLDGAPGVYTADWAETKTGRNFEHAMRKVWDALDRKEVPFPRKARFVCTLVLIWPDKHEEVFEGKADGTLTWPGRGLNGHGFDPIFIPKSYKITYGEMDRWEKNRISHRAIAFQKMIKQCFEDHEKSAN